MPVRDDQDGGYLRLWWRLDALDLWRAQVDRELAVMKDKLDGLAEADRIAAAVAGAIRDKPPTMQAITAGLSGWQRWGAFAAGALLLADAVKGLLRGLLPL